MSAELLKTEYQRVAYLYNLLRSRATGGDANDREYKFLRQHLLEKNNKLSSLLPDWLRTHRDLHSFWGFIQPEFKTYAERRSFLADEFTPALNYAEFGEQVSVSTSPRANVERLPDSVLLTAEVSNENNQLHITPKQYSLNDPFSQQTINMQKISLSISSLLGMLTENVDAVDRRLNVTPSMDFNLREDYDLLAHVRILIEELQKTQRLIETNASVTEEVIPSLKDEALREFVLKFSGATGAGLGNSITWGAKLAVCLLVINVLEGAGFGVDDLFAALKKVKGL